MKKVLTMAVCLVIALAFAGKAYSLDATTTAKDTAKITDKPTVAETAKTGIMQEKVTFKSYNANNNTITVIKDKKEMTVPVKNPAHWANTKQFENKTIVYTSTYDPKMLTQVATDPKLAE